MQPRMTRQPIRVATRSADQEGCLILADGNLVAVVVRLAEELHGTLKGAWFLEASFGAADTPPPSFPDIDAAEAWLARQL